MSIFKDDFIGIRVTQEEKSRFKSFASVNFDKLSEVVIRLLNWACKHPDLYKDIKREEV